MRPLPPTRRLSRSVSPMVTAAVVAAALVTAAVVAASCGSAPAPAVDGLLVAADGRLRVSDGSGALASFDGPVDTVFAVTAAGGRVVAGTAEGVLWTSPKTGGGTAAWEKLAAPRALSAGPPLMTLSPLGKELAVAVGDPQGKRFDLVLLDIRTGTSRTIPVARGLNGPPAWIGPATVAINVLGPTDHAEIATIDIASGDLTDETATATVLAAAADGQRVAVDQPRGDVLIGEVEAWRQGALASMARLPARTGSTVESLAISAEGRRLALVRRDEAGAASLELYVAIDAAWASVRSHSFMGDGPISIAWLR
jgi:hypothetical protein